MTAEEKRRTVQCESCNRELEWKDSGPSYYFPVPQPEEVPDHKLKMWALETVDEEDFEAEDRGFACSGNCVDVWEEEHA